MVIILLLVLLTVIVVWRSGKYELITGRLYAFITHTTQDAKEDAVREIKQNLFRDLHELSREQEGLKLLEIGTGSGLNFKFMPPGCELVCVEPEPCYDPYIYKNAEKFVKSSTVQIVHQPAGDLDMFEDDYFDGVIVTHLLCLIPDEMRLLRAIRRVLKPVSYS